MNGVTMESLNSSQDCLDRLINELSHEDELRMRRFSTPVRPKPVLAFVDNSLTGLRSRNVPRCRDNYTKFMIDKPMWISVVDTKAGMLAGNGKSER